MSGLGVQPALEEGHGSSLSPFLHFHTARQNREGNVDDSRGFMKRGKKKTQI